jgi:uncharacterized protein (TIGR03000 family)
LEGLPYYPYAAYPRYGNPSNGYAPANYPYYIPPNYFGMPPMNFSTLAPLNATANYWPSAAAGLQPLSSGTPTGAMALNPNVALIGVKVPPDARVWFDGEATRQTGTDRLFSSPELEQGKRYNYDIRAQWTVDGKPVTRTRTVHFRAGEHVSVDFMNSGG